jgi:23S rRNA pseudouridine2605 synthase
MPEVRLQKALADAGVASRRGAEVMIAAGRVTVDGLPARSSQQSTRPAGGGRGRRRIGRCWHIYLALDKPIRVTSTGQRPACERTVVQMVPADVRRRAGRLFPVGRLTAT